MKKRSLFNNRQPVCGLSRLLVHGIGFFALAAGTLGFMAPVSPVHAQQFVSEKPGIQFHKSLPRKIREEIKIIDDFTVEVGLGSDRKSVSGSIEDAVQSIPLVGRGNKPKKAFIGDTRIYKQKNGLYTWDKRGRKDVRLSAKYIKRRGVIRVSLERKARPVEPVAEPARKPEKTETPATTITRKPASITGFRSARFGMLENEIYKAVATDFQIRGDQVEPITDMVNKTSGLAVTVPDLLANSGLAKVAYVFGYKTKKLIQVNVLWGFPVTPTPNAQTLVSTANALRDHFLKKGFPKETIIINQRRNDGSILVFRGADEKGRGVLLFLSAIQNPSSGQPPQQNPKSFLRLSYVENPVAPDVFQIKPGEF